ncbi:MAG: zinc-ribbon domain-containing protein, partial [Ktedonobacteraceae bacterium]|nr:zinc-ribbon domain-containing protein [Ktedonobacteraceae bacterium]
MLCPLCHTENRDNAKFCKRCGRVLIEEGAASQQPISAEQHADAVSAQPVQASEVAPSSFQAVEDTRYGQSSPSSQQIGESSATVESTAPAHSSQPQDISTEPTQILMPQQMLALHQKRWQEEIERERQSAVSDVSDMPTILQNMTQSATPGTAPDISDYPTIITPSMNDSVSGAPMQNPSSQSFPSAAAAQGAEVPLPSSFPLAEAQPAAEAAPSAGKPTTSAEESSRITESAPSIESSVAPDIVYKNETTNGQMHEVEQNMAAKTTAAVSTSNEESSVEQTTGPEAASEQVNVPETTSNTDTVQQVSTGSVQEPAGAAFPLLAVGTLVDGRYEV